MSKTVVLDNGHGGMINGVYQTAGKRSPKYSRGVLYEGMFNRWVVNRIKEQLDRLSIPYYNISPEDKDVSLSSRVSRADAIYNENRDTWLLSIHANGGGGKGIEGFTSVGETGSDAIAEIVLGNLERDLKNQSMRFDMSDGDKDKESNFYILRNPAMPAFLLECGFMDNEADYTNLWDKCYMELLVNSIVRSIKEIYEN
jgi:N-acetylmuramoyl-L-alanine amidase